jgi:glycosyltransferase involved in cell wall biosynthesis
MPGISVIIPTYNRRKQVLEALASVRAQTHAPFEILVVDDGSTDDTEEHVGQLGGTVRYFKTRNRGVSSARNHGIQMAEGDWIAFLDSDDEWDPGKLARQVACVERTGAKVCLTGCENEEGMRLDDLEAMDPFLDAGGEETYSSSDYRFFRHPRHPYIQTALVSRQALLEIGGFDETLRVAEDTKLLYRLVMAHGYAAVNEPMVRICRKRNECGLSDDPDPSIAALRYDCYARVQSEFSRAMMGRDQNVAEALNANYRYFVSRRAELACVLRDAPLARTLGREGLAPGGDVKSRLRSLLILISPQAFGAFARRKWRRG